jgi:hypothetical protein
VIDYAPATDFDALLDAVAERMAKDELGSTEKKTVAGIRNKIRWEAPSNGSKVRIMRCGSKVAGKSNVILEISATGAYKDLYPLAQEAVRLRAEKQSATGSKRVSHKGIDTDLLLSKVAEKKGSK